MGDASVKRTGLVRSVSWRRIDGSMNDSPRCTLRIASRRTAGMLDLTTLAGSGGQGRAQIARLLVHRHHQHARRRAALANLGNHADAAAVWKGDIEYDDVRFGGFRLAQRLVGSRCLGHDFHVRLSVQQQLERLAQ